MVLTPNEVNFLLFIVCGLLTLIFIGICWFVNKVWQIGEDVSEIKSQLAAGDEKHKGYDSKHEDYERRIRELEFVRSRNKN